MAEEGKFHAVDKELTELMTKHSTTEEDKTQLTSEDDSVTDDADSEPVTDEETEEREEGKDLILLHRRECIECGYLVSHLGENPASYKLADKEGCHYTDGNESCPAGALRIVVGVNFDAASDGLAEAWRASDVQRIDKIMRKLQKVDEAISRKVLDMAREKLIAGG